MMPQAPRVHRPAYLGTVEEAEQARQKDLNRRRGSAASRGYGHRWRKASVGYRRKHTLCVCCLARFSRTTTAELVDHIVPHKGDMKIFWDRSNWQSLCDNCDKTIKRALEHEYAQGLVAEADLDLSRPPEGEGVSNP